MRWLENKSIIFVAERRMGKTFVLKELEKRYDDGTIIIYSDLEKIKSVEELEKEVYKNIKKNISLWDKIKLKSADNLKSFFDSIDHENIPKYNKNSDWKSIFSETIKKICEKNRKKVIFLWDELPYMLQNIYELDTKNETTHALDLVDVLRALDNEVDNLRFIFTGSIGLHHIQNLITQGKNSEPFNNMQRVELLPLSLNYAKEMTQTHLKEEELLALSTDKKVVEYICKSCDCVPFYIEKIVKKLSLIEENITLERVKDEINLMIADDTNELEMEHFLSRLKIYYTKEIEQSSGDKINISDVAHSVLKYFSQEEQRFDAKETLRYLKSIYSIESEKEVQNILTLLAKDYYIQGDADKKYQFKFSIIKQWWAKNG